MPSDGPGQQSDRECGADYPPEGHSRRVGRARLAAFYEDNYFSLLPGESRTFRWNSPRQIWRARRPGWQWKAGTLCLGRFRCQ